MRYKYHLFFAFCLLFLMAFVKTQEPVKILSYSIDPAAQHLQMFYKVNGVPLRSIANLKQHVESNKQKLLFAMNGGMYMADNTPVGLYIDNKKQVTPLNTKSGDGNFYMQPNGVFYVTQSGKAVVCNTASFKADAGITYATQSGPMLVHNGVINPAFKQGSTNLNVRNGVGILPGNKVLFAISNGQVNFYDFARFFKDAGCVNALYLDGFVSRAYMPEQGHKDIDGDFGVMIAVTKPL